MCKTCITAAPHGSMYLANEWCCGWQIVPNIPSILLIRSRISVKQECIQLMRHIQPHPIGIGKCCNAPSWYLHLHTPSLVSMSKLNWPNYPGQRTEMHHSVSLDHAGIESLRTCLLDVQERHTQTQPSRKRIMIDIWIKSFSLLVTAILRLS